MANKVISDITKGTMLGFVGTMLGSITTIKESVGTFKGTIKSEASFRQFVAKGGDHAGEKYGVLECSVELETKNTVKARVDTAFQGAVGDSVTIEITESTDKKYKNALII
ncbi:MAG: hypothetical protein WCO84_06815 [bacterium]